MANFNIENFFMRFKGIFFFIFFLILQLLLAWLIFYFFTDERIYAQILSSLIFLLLFYLLEVKYPQYAPFFDHNENWFVTMGKSLKVSLIAFVSGYIITFSFILITEKFLLPEHVIKYINMPNQAIVDVIASLNKKNNNITVVFWFLSIIVLGPLTEEILFRGFLQDFLSNLIKNKKIVIATTAIIFSLFHLPSVSNMLFTLTVGIFLSIEKERSGTINIPIWVHSIINFTGILTTIIFQQVLIKNSI